MEMRGLLGESLGTIGQQPKEQSPEWLKGFQPKPSISTRKGYAAGYEPPYEDTSTIVLTARSGKFVDIRFPLDLKSPDDLFTHPAFWAFAGTVVTTIIAPKVGQPHAVGLQYSAHSVFTHEIDTKGPDIEDEGDMFMLSNGDQMEVGFGISPVTGKVGMYKEYWTEPTPLLTSGTGNEGTAGAYSKRPCFVAETASNGSVHGILIRVGDLMQGIFDHGKTESKQSISVSRWELTNGRGPSTWVLHGLSEQKHDCFPHRWLGEPQLGLKQGDVMQTDNGQAWKITEVEW